MEPKLKITADVLRALDGKEARAIDFSYDDGILKPWNIRYISTNLRKPKPKSKFVLWFLHRFSRRYKMKIRQMKQELKALAETIKIGHNTFKQAQREVSIYDRTFPNSRTYKHPEYELRKPLGDKLWKSMGYTADSWEFRHKHIAYCMLRGTPYEKIEQKVNEGNKPNWKKIEKYMEEYREQAVRDCAG